MLDFRVFNVCAINIAEWKLISIVLTEDFITTVLLLLVQGHGDDLILVADIGKEESWSKDFSANKLAVVDYVWVNLKDFVDVDDLGNLLRFSDI